MLGAPDPLCGEAVVAFIVRRDPALTAEQVRQHAKTSLTNYKVPKTIVFRDELPKSNVGKVLRKDLKTRRGTRRIRADARLMDNLCHTLAGAALGEAGLKRQTTLGMATLMIASNLPTSTWPSLRPTRWRCRSAAAGRTACWRWRCLPALLAGVMFVMRVACAAVAAEHGEPASSRRRRVAGSTCTGLLLLCLPRHMAARVHGLAEQLRRAAAHAVFGSMVLRRRALHRRSAAVSDLRAAIVLARRAACARQRPHRGGRRASACSRRGVYMALMLASNWWARAEVARGLARAGRADTRFMVTPVFANPLRREVIVDVGDRYEKGFLWFEPLPHFRPAGYGVDKNLSDPAVVQALQTPRIQAFLLWSRFPFFVVEREATRTRVVVNDYRYSGPSGRDGWATQFVAFPRGDRWVLRDRRQHSAWAGSCLASTQSVRRHPAAGPKARRSGSDPAAVQ